MRLEAASNARQAALTLHAMAPHDAAWLLQQLPAIEAAELQSLLEELRSLGMPCDPGFLDELRKEGEVPRQPALANAGTANTDGQSLEALMNELDAAHADRLLPILKPEPVVLLAFLLSLKSWSWAGALFAALETHRRLSLRQQVDSLDAGAAGAQASQLQRVLLQRLLQRYRHAGAGALSRDAVNAQPGGFAHWWQERRRFWSSIVAPMKAFK